MSLDISLAMPQEDAAKGPLAGGGTPGDDLLLEDDCFMLNEMGDSILIE